MDKRFLTILATLVIVFGAIFAFSQHKNETSKTNSGNDQPSNHIAGEGSKNVTLVEYGDFQCAVCAIYEPVVNQVRTAYAQDIRFQFRNLPLSSVHPNAFAASRAAEAASLQNKFWEMHDALYNQSDWSTWTNSNSPLDLFAGYAKQMGLNEAQFRTDFASGEVNSTIQADLSAFKKTNKEMATPTFFLNGTYVENSKLSDQNNRPLFEKFKALIDAEITKQQPKQ